MTSRPRLRKLAVPKGIPAKDIATTLSIRYQDVPGVRISPDSKRGELVVLAPEQTHGQIAKDVQSLVNRGQMRLAAAESSGPMKHRLQNISWQELERNLQLVATNRPDITSSTQGQRATYRFVQAPVEGSIVDVHRGSNQVVVTAPAAVMSGWRTLIASLDQKATRGTVSAIARMENAEMAPIQRAIRLLQELKVPQPQQAAEASSPYRNAVFQLPEGGQGEAGGAQTAEGGNEAGEDEGGSGVIGDVEIRYVPELDQIILRGSKRDVQKVMEIINEIKQNADATQPEVEVLPLKHADSNAVADLLTQLYDDYLSARQGSVSISALDTPNALLLIGREEAINALKDLINKIDVSIDDASRLRVFRLRHASAIDAETTVRDFFTARPGTENDVRPGIGIRVRVIADYRTNSLVVSASPRDMAEVTRMINELDVRDIAAQNEIKVFQLNNASAEDMAPVIQSAISGEGDGAATNENITRPAAALTMVAVDENGERIVDSGVLSGATVTADSGANAIVVNAPAASMPLIAELIRQLDRAPGIDSLVKVFTVKHGDATQLFEALTNLFGEDAGTVGTAIGAGNLAGLPPATAGGESTLVPLRFSVDVRSNSIIASGSGEDLEVVESILLRLDGEGFADRITEVIWLRNNDADLIAQALNDYVSARQTGQNVIQQFQEGLSVYDFQERDLIVVPETNSNSLLLSVSPRIYEEIRELIDRLDRRRPMVLIKVLIAEVGLDDTFEIGGELGLQDSLLFNRGLAVGQIPGADAPSAPGFNFNNAGLPNVNLSGRETLAAAGVSTFGVGTTNPGVGFGGFVLNAASDSVSMLLRTLQDANRLQVLSRPQIMTMDNTEAQVNVGRRIARVTDIVNNLNGTQVVTTDVDVGLILNVRPRVGADGLILMEVNATRSDRDPANGTIVPAGDGTTVFIDDLLNTTAQSVLTAYSGQTVIFGGLIQKSRTAFSRRVPFVADIPILGHLFKYDQEQEIRSELLIIMTPMVVTGEQDLEYVKQVESSRMSWCLADVVEAHGDVGLSGGYGLWGPAVGQTIYPDLHPTVQREEVISDRPLHSPPPALEQSPIQIQAPQVLTDPIEPGLITPQVDTLPVPSNAVPAPAPVIEAPPAPTTGAQNLNRSESIVKPALPVLPAKTLSDPESPAVPATYQMPSSDKQPRTAAVQPISGFDNGETKTSQVSWLNKSKSQVDSLQLPPKRLGVPAKTAKKKVPSIFPTNWIR